MIDTNVLISAVIKEGSVPDQVVLNVLKNHELILCKQIVKECIEVTERRFPDKKSQMDIMLKLLPIELVEGPSHDFIKINDLKDQPIVNAALHNNIDVLVTGDKHFFEFKCPDLFICTPSAYLAKFGK